MTSHGASNVTESNDAIDAANARRDANATVRAVFLAPGATEVGLDWYGGTQGDYWTEDVSKEYRLTLEAAIRKFVPTAAIVGGEVYCELGEMPLVREMEGQAEKNGESWIDVLREDIDVAAIAARHLKAQVINLTPHEIIVAGGEFKGVYPPSGEVARLITTEVMRGDRRTVVYSSKLIGLPRETEGKTYAVSTMCAMAAHDRSDVVAPYGQIRDADGRIVACEFLVAVEVD